MTDRDTFAAAALTGLLAKWHLGDDEPDDSFARFTAFAAYDIADAMLRERLRLDDAGYTGGISPGGESKPLLADAMLREREQAAQKMAEIDSLRAVSTNHDAAPAARADSTDERPPNAVSANGGTPCAASRDGSGTGNTPQTHATPPQGSVHGEGRFPDSRNWNEPVAWAVIGKERLSGHVFGLHDTAMEAHARVGRMVSYGEIITADKVEVVPLYRHPQPTLTDEEREAVRVARDAYADDDGNAECEEIAAVLTSVLERLGGGR